MKPKLPFEKALEPIFLHRFPPFSDFVKELFVRFGPYFLLFFSLIIVIIILLALGIGGASAGFGAVSLGIGFNFYVSVLLGMACVTTTIMAFQPLRARKWSGWRLIYYALLLCLGSILFELKIIILAIVGLLGFWILFQIREKYS